MTISRENLDRLIDLVMKTGIHIRLKSDSICAACQYVHRFYLFSQKEYDAGVVVVTAISSACKVNGNKIDLPELISSVHFHVHNSIPNAELNYDSYKQLPNDENFERLKTSAANFELFMLRTLDFELSVDLPHKYQLIYLKTLSDWINDREILEKLFTLAWSLLNDYSCKLLLSTEWLPKQTALISIDIAIDHTLPETKEIIRKNQINQNWYTHFDKTLTNKSAVKIRHEILTFLNFSTLDVTS